MFQRFGVTCRLALYIPLVLYSGIAYGQPWPNPVWQTASSPAEVGFWSSGLEIYRAWLENNVSDGPYGTVVIRFGKIAFEEYGGGANAESKWEVGSIRKPIAGALLGMGIEEGIISLDSVVFDVWPEIFTITGEDKDQGITLRQLVTGTSGWRASSQPGEYWRYSNLGFTASHAVVGRAYGLVDDEVAPLVESRIKDVIGATSWDVYHFPNNWHNNPGPKLAVDSTMRDLSRYGYLWLREGEWDGNQLLPVSYILEAQQNQVVSYGRHYGYYWFTNDGKELLPDAPDDAYYHIGNGVGGRRTVLLVAPSLDLVAVLSTDQDAYNLGGEDFLSEPVQSVNEWVRQIVAAVQVSIFEDRFSGADSEDVGNDWTEVETPTSAIGLEGGAAFFDSENHAFRPLLHHPLPSRSSGSVTWIFDLDFKRSGSEESYSFWMQLGQRSSMDDHAPTAGGVAVNLRWGDPGETFGCVVDGMVTKVASPVTGRHTVTVRVDLDAQTYDVAVAGEVVSGIAFEGSVPIDTIRFFSHLLDGYNFSSRRVDDVVVVDSTPVNFAPVASNKDWVTELNVSVGIPMSFTDPDGPGPFMATVNDPANGTLSGMFPSLIYTPNVDFEGPDTFTWSIHDGISESNFATVTVISGVPDADNDGVSDFDDNCPTNSNSSQADTDSDGEGDACDADDDDDGLVDSSDNCRLDVNQGQADTDNDGAGDVCDPDDDNDGVEDLVDNCQWAGNESQDDTDRDREGDACDMDDDDDGVPDTEDNCPLVTNMDQEDTDGAAPGDACSEDDDGDGVPDTDDNCMKDANVEQINTDGDSAGDACDQDDDGDGIIDTEDNCPLGPNAEQRDADGDGHGDVCDEDDEDDGVNDSEDNCPGVVNGEQIDTDGDSFGDPCDDDDDGDGVVDSIDNCALISNFEQKDTDGDGGGDVCDGDDDGDSVDDLSDNCPLAANSEQVDTDIDGEGDVCDFDDDGDGVVDITDNCPFVVNAAQIDTDIDGEGDVCDPDVDGDGLVNITDNCPLAANPEQTDTDLDGDGDVCDSDDDGDGILDITDNCRTVPNVDQSNSDLDEVVGDACDLDDDDDGNLDDVDNCRTTYNPGQEDADGDAVGDKCDEDLDGDDVNNAVDNCASMSNPDQADSDEDGLGDTCDRDDDNDDLLDGVDNCPRDYNPDQGDWDRDGLGDACDVSVFPEFIRGDVNENGRTEIGDPVTILFYLFRGTAEIDCLDVADTNDDGQVDLPDAVYILRYQFLGGDPPPAPFPERGIDPTADGLPVCEGH